MNKRQEVNKGLRSLLSNIEKTSNVAERSQLVKELTHSIGMIKMEWIEVNPYQPRTEFDEAQLSELAKSIQVSGLIQPITVRSLGGNKYQLISGERRLRASTMAGLKEIPAYIRVANDQEMLEMALVENIQRSDLNALEVAISYQRLMDECQLTHEALAERVGKERSTISNYVRLLKLPAAIQNSVKEGKISMGHARALAGVDNLALQLQCHRDILEQGLSVRALESKIKNFQIPKNHEVQGQRMPSAVDAEIKKIKEKISHHLGTKVQIKRNAVGQGCFVIDFNSDEEFNKISDILTQG
jgi:ParB family chromosome partitioning protein